jgi:hypothetical protein
MSSSRTDAIRHFGSARAYKRLTIGQALEAAPVAVRNGLAPEDLHWIKRFADVPAREAAKRLAVRSRDNPDGLLPEGGTSAAPAATAVATTAQTWPKVQYLVGDEVLVEDSDGWRLWFAQAAAAEAGNDQDDTESLPQRQVEVTLHDPAGETVFARMGLSGDAHGDYLVWASNGGFEVGDATAFVRRVERLVDAAEAAADRKASSRDEVRKLTLRLPGDVVQTLREIAEPWGLSARTTEIVRQHVEIMRTSTPEFALHEWCAICDALNGWAAFDADAMGVTTAWANIHDAATGDGLGEKWGIDAIALAVKVRELPYPAAVAVCEIARRFWASPRLNRLGNRELLLSVGARLSAG